MSTSIFADRFLIDLQALTKKSRPGPNRVIVAIIKRKYGVYVCKVSGKCAYINIMVIIEAIMQRISHPVCRGVCVACFDGKRSFAV
jgi:hypothetical protein